MHRGDPTSSDSSFVCAVDHDFSLEEVAAIQTQGAPPVIPLPEPTASPEQALAPAVPGPSIPIVPKLPVLARRTVSGRYQSAGASIRLELRVDVDGKRPMMKVSGDFYQISGGTTTYYGSFVVDAPTIHVLPASVTIDGLGRFTFTAGAPKVHIAIPRNVILLPPGAATLQFFTMANVPGAQYICQYVSSLFRTVTFETDRVANVATPVFSSYNTGSQPSGGPARNLSVVSAYAEAGIELQVTGASDVIPLPEANWDPADHTANKWDDAELHHSMELHFSQWHDIPQWAVWEVVCQEHVLGPSLYGIMFDQQGKQRQGCAVFHAGIGGVTPDKLRLQLYTYVHELGHCFNLLHSWQKSYATPPQPNRPGALSWMNYPWNYPGGAAAFWNGFAFQFDDPEVVHLRHAFRKDIIMGGNNFAFGSALDETVFDDNLEDNSGLKLEISVEKANSSFMFGEPVSLKLRLTGEQGRLVHPHLHPDSGFLQLGICRPNGEVLVYRPAIEHCVATQPVAFGPENPALEEVVYCGYGKDGFYFDRTGFYQVRAVYNAPDGSRVVSNILRMRVRHPVTVVDEEVADLFFGQEQGMLFYLQGSDSEFLRHGNDCLNTVLEKHPTHPLANYALLIHAINAGRAFKTIDTKAKRIRARLPKLEESAKMLTRVIDTSEKTAILGSHALDKAVHILAGVQMRMGDNAGAEATQKRAPGVGKKSLTGIS